MELSEHQEQAALVQWWDLNCKRLGYPAIALFAIPNGGKRTVGYGGKLKGEGMRPGVYDLFLAIPRNGYNGLFIEMKYAKNKPSPEQVEFGRFVATQGYRQTVCWSWQVAIHEIEEYLK